MRSFPSLTAVIVLAGAVHAFHADPIAATDPSLAVAAEEDAPAGLAAEDWNGIRAAYDAGRHAVRPVEGGYRARNPGQRWRMHFDGRAFTAQPDGGGWTWGLQLLRYGFDGGERDMTSPEHETVDGGRVAYDWDTTLQEWYVNDTRGLEHGYTVRSRPTGDEAEPGPLTFTLAVLGELTPLVDAGGRNVRFLDEGGSTALTYSGLAVFDADGRFLPARFERVDEGLRLSVDEGGARYPLTVDPVAQQAFLKAPDAEPYDGFGWSVSMSGETLAISAQGSDEGLGAVYVFVRDGSVWSQQGYLQASNVEASDAFGLSVSISGDTVVVGAPAEDSNATGVNGDQSDNSAPGSGAAYVFVRNGTTWSQQAYLKASNSSAGDGFGQVSVSGDTVAIGAAGEDSNATGVNGDQGDNSTPGSGAAYVFVRDGTTWSQQAYLKASNPDAGDGFGVLSVSGDTVVVGALLEDSNTTGVNGNQFNDQGANQSGAAYVFVRDGTTWSQQAYLKASNTGHHDQFGIDVSISGDTVVIGAHQEDSNATGVNGNQGDNNSPDAGAAYVFVRDGTTWSQQAYLKASNTGDDDSFGYDVYVSGDTVVVGAPLEDSGATGVDGDQSDDTYIYSGAAYAFVRDGTAWSQLAYLKASNTGVRDFFGNEVTVSGDTVVAGVVFEDSDATGMDPFGAYNSGAVYVFDLDAVTTTSFCDDSDGALAFCPCSNPGAPDAGCDIAQSTGGVRLEFLSQQTSPQNRTTLTGTGYPASSTPSAVALRAPSLDVAAPVPFGDGLRCVRTPVVRLGAATALGGVSTHTFGHGSTPGTFYYQLWFRNTPMSYCDPAAAFNLSNGGTLTW